MGVEFRTFAGNDAATSSANVQEAKDEAPRHPALSYNFRAAAWRWHFYAGMLVSPLLLIVAATGALLVFQQEFDQWLYRDLLFVEPRTGEPVSIELMRDNVVRGLAPLGEAEVGDVLLLDAKNRSAEFFATIDDTYYVFAFADPGDGRYLGHFMFEKSPMRMIEQLHRRLLLPRNRMIGEQTSETGSTLVELATSWAIILLITGLYLWWPRRASSVWGVWLPRVRGRSYRVWRDWHTVPAVYLAVFTLLVAISGLVFSTWWGSGARAVQESTADVEPISLYRNTELRDPDKPVLDYDAILGIVRRIPMEKSTGVGIREVTPGGRYVVAVGYNRETYNPATGYYNLIDVHTGDVVETQRWGDYNALTKARMSAYSVHVGSIFGMPTKILAVLVCVGLMVGSVSGAVMWWKRRPNGKTGLPKRSSVTVPPWWFTLLVLGVAAFFPVAGVSFIVVLVLDRLYVLTRNRWRNRSVRSMA